MSAPAAPDGPRMDERFAQRRAEVDAERQRRRRRSLRSAALLVIVAAGVIALARSPLLAITEVRVVGVSGAQAAAARDAGGIAVGDNLLAVEVGAAAAAVEALPWVAEAEVIRLPPAAVEVRVTARQPVALVRLAGESWEVDGDGVVLRGGGGDGLVRVDAPAATLPRPGGVVADEGVAAALAFHLEVPEGLATRVRRYVVDEGAQGLGMEVEIPSGHIVRVRLGDAQQAALKASVVEALLAQSSVLVEDGQVRGEVDVRAPENPVVVPFESP